MLVYFFMSNRETSVTILQTIINYENVTVKIMNDDDDVKENVSQNLIHEIILSQSIRLYASRDNYLTKSCHFT